MINIFYLANKKVFVKDFDKKILSEDDRRVNLYLFENGFYKRQSGEI